MITTKDALKKASAKTIRRARYEIELEREALLDCVFAANNTREFRLLMEAKVFADARFDQLPQYRKVALDAYVRGAVDALSHRLGQPLSEPYDLIKPRPRAPSIFPATKRPSARASNISALGPAGSSFPNVFETFNEKLAARTPDGKVGR